MELFIIFTGLLFSVFATLILSYISIATMVGPWIAPTIVLICHILLAGMRNGKKKTSWLVSIQAIGGGGGIIATGIGFAFPMLYFLDPGTFKTLMASPGHFCLFLSVLCIVAGGLGLVLGNYLTPSLVDAQALPFPVSNLTTQIATTDSSREQTGMLLGGIIGTGVLCALRDGIWAFKGILKKTYYAMPWFFGKEAAFSIWPILWAIGFSVGLPITIPLVIGMIAKYAVVLPLSQHALYLPLRVFKPVEPETFAIAFCSGLVACELILQLPGFIKKLWARKQSPHHMPAHAKLQVFCQNIANAIRSWSPITLSIASALLVSTMLFLYIYDFSITAQLLLLIFSGIAVLSICTIGGKIGMIPFGRYSTFIVVPLFLLFNLSPLQATIVCVFFNIAAAAASDLLFDIKSGDLVGISRCKMYRYQWIGLIGSALCIGMVLWLLFSNLELGSEALFAQRSKAKALLLQSLNLDTTIVFLGICFGWVLKRFKINSTMVFGGLVMPNSVTLGLLIGSLGTLLVKKQERWAPLCAGILAADSLWVMATILLAK
ncbi:hypothetical protein FJ365_01220 [Candidatus Dependentiae bacterium]|nr:hypothetical protein [Candidatus Dependentiae bacterium]